MFTCFYAYFSECGLGLVEIMLAEEGYAGGYDSTVNSIKGLSFAMLIAIWGGVSVSYGKKITNMLKTGGGGAAEKAIRKFMRAIVICLSLAMCYKLLFAALRIPINGTIFELPTCSNSYFDIIGVLFLVIQFVILVAQNPNTGKAKKAQTKVTTTMSTSSSVDP